MKICKYKKKLKNARKDIEVIKHYSQDLVEIDFKKAIESFKMKTKAKGRVSDYYEILYLYPPQPKSPWTITEGDD